MKRAFTLIELLIVVAIIAILAAIAVPNFLEAQVRAKASRAKSDLRTVVTALETYAVDNNKYPPPRVSAAVNQTGAPSNTLAEPHSCSQFVPGGDHDIDGNPYTGGLTTPIAYITSVLKDVFAQQSYNMDHNDLGYQNVYFYSSVAAGGEGHAIAEGENGTTSLGFADPGPTPPKASYMEKYGAYIIRSIGPDRGYSSVNNPYDSTNGTVSNGDIYRTQLRAKNNRSVGGE